MSGPDLRLGSYAGDEGIRIICGKIISQGKIAPDQPRLRVLYMSGYAGDMLSRHGVLNPGVMFLAKPFTPDKLLLQVRAVLGADE